MHLINIGSFKLKEITREQKPEYAILSHRWGKKEPSFEEMKTVKIRSTSSKVQGAVRQTRQDGHRYLWIDSCCIDRQSSAELSEAINSMYKWYQGATVCYAYLQDVEARCWQGTLRTSEWFRRGWTLQELLAPQKVAFYDKNWQRFGDRISLADDISTITGIPVEVFRTGNLDGFSVAQKMSWAARRRTTRLEDCAYCLMGLFNVNMPLLYGEGSKAFVRLQEEIIRHSDDHSIFAWSMGERRASGLLAPAPSCFFGSRKMVPHITAVPREPFSMTNRGLAIRYRLTPWCTDTYLVYLDCAEQEDSSCDEYHKRTTVCIFLRRLHEDDQYIRIRICRGGLWLDKKNTESDINRPIRNMQIFVRQTCNLSLYADCLDYGVYGFHIFPEGVPASAEVRGCHVLQHGRMVLVGHGGWGCGAVIDLFDQDQSIHRISLGFDFEFNPVCLLRERASDCDDRTIELQDQDNWMRILNDDMDWDEIIEGSRVFRGLTKPCGGLWAIKGHRKRGLDVLLSRNMSDRGALATFKRNKNQAGWIWEFDIDSLVGPFRNLHHPALRNAFGNRQNFQRVYGLDNDQEGLEDGDGILGKLYPSIPDQKRGCHLAMQR